MVTVKELAKLCGVSPSTVSNILNNRPNVGEDTRKRVLEAVKETGYQPNYFAASMRRQNSRVISIIVEDLNQFTTPPMVGEIMAYCEELGYRTILMDLRLYERWQDTWYDDEAKLWSVLEPALQEIQSVKVDGNIYVAGHGRAIRCFPQEYAIPTVIAYAMSDMDRFPSVLVDDEKGGYDMGKYLISMGHTKIAIIAGAENNLHAQQRLSGFQKAMFEAGIPYNPEWTFRGNWEKETGYELAPLAMGVEPTVIWCMNDQMAGGVYQYLYERGIAVGKDISVAGYDKMNVYSYMNPKLTTMELPLEEIGRKSAEIVIKMIENEGWTPENMKTWIPCVMKIGGSVIKEE